MDIQFEGGMEIKGPDKGVVPLRDPGLKGRVTLHPENGAKLDPDFMIFVSEATLEEIREFSATDLQHEVGGLLLGGFHRDEEAEPGKPAEFVVIDGFLPAKHGKSQHASFTFTHDTFGEATREQEKTFPDKRMVGWHHTHPTFGIFLSGHDVFIQEHFFNLYWMVALVVDPVRKTMGFLRIRSQGTRPVRCPFWVIRDKKQRQGKR